MLWRIHPTRSTSSSSGTSSASSICSNARATRGSAVGSIRREHVESFIEDLDTRFKPATLGVRFRSLQQLFRCLIDEGEITSNPMERMRSPAIPEDPPAVLSDTELRALLKACEGTDVVARRDAVILRTFIDTGARLSEVANLRMADVDLDDQTLTVLGEGSRVRILPIGAKTVKAIDRYLRVRRSDLAELWIGGKGPMTPSGIVQMIRRRATAAGIGHVHPHQFRRTFAHRWLSSEGQEGDLQEIAGWRSRGDAAPLRRVLEGREGT